jgi:hypothetical protein
VAFRRELECVTDEIQDDLREANAISQTPIEEVRRTRGRERESLDSRARSERAQDLAKHAPERKGGSRQNERVRFGARHVEEAVEQPQEQRA